MHREIERCQKFKEGKMGVKSLLKKRSFTFSPSFLNKYLINTIYTMMAKLESFL